jgi:16S rRNA processing protein RimM
MNVRGDEVTPQSDRQGLWACGTLGKVHGLRGELYLNLSPDGLEHLRLGADFYVARPDQDAPEGAERLTPCVVTRAGGTDRRPLVRLDLATTREQAIALQGMELLAAGGELDELPFYRVGDLIGLRVETASGYLLGTVSEVLEAPAHEVLQVRAPDGAALYLPLVDELVSVAAEAGLLRVVDGLIDVPSEEPAGEPRIGDEGAPGEASRPGASAP